MKYTEIKKAVLDVDDKARKNSVHHLPKKGKSFAFKGVSFQARCALILNPLSRRETFVGGMQEAHDLIITVDGMRLRIEIKQGESTIAKAYPENGLPLNSEFILRRSGTVVPVRVGMLERSKLVFFNPVFEADDDDETLIENTYVIPVDEFWEFCSTTKGICGYRASRGWVQIQPLYTTPSMHKALERTLDFCAEYPTMREFMSEHKVCCNDFDYTLTF